MINDSYENGRLPNSLYEANICVLLKKGKDDMDLASYRPISLLNFDQKVITKVLSNRLGKHISTIVHPDQSGFIPGRFSFGNVRLLLNILYKERGKEASGAIISLDAQKAFDQIEWPFMLKALEHFGAGSRFIKWVKILYLCPRSSILTNSNKSKPFDLHRGVRQGDPLSPLLFDIALEPLAVGIRSHPHIHGIKMGKDEALVSLYADDLLIYLSDPAKSVPYLLEYINAFGKISGYTINWSKSEYMSLARHTNPSQVGPSLFKTVEDHFTYLGIVVPKNPKQIFKLNFLAKIDKLKDNIERWRLLPLSMIGKINAIKMVILPQFLYLFQNVPTYIPLSFFKLLDSVIMPFIWAYKTPRIAKAHLQKPTQMGGLGLPVFKYYYWAANARALSYWQRGIPGEAFSAADPLWLKIETSSLTTSCLPVLLFSKVSPSSKLIGTNFIVKNSIRILNQIRKHLKSPDVSILTPIANNHMFKPSQLDRGFVEWKTKGLMSIGDLYIDDKFASFNQLQSVFNLPRSDFFRYLQVRHYVQTVIPQFMDKPEINSFEKTLLVNPSSRHLVSRCVNSLQLPVSTNHIKEAWARDFDEDVSDETWNDSLNKIQDCSINARHRLIQFKVVHRLYYSKTKLSKIYNSISPVCDRCKTEEGSLSHMFWFCHKLFNFWTAIFDFFSKVFQKEVKPDHSLAILGSSVTLNTLPRSQQRPLLMGLTLAKKSILLNWKSSDSPSFKAWLSELIHVIQLERIRSLESKSHRQFQTVWQPFVDFLKSE